MDDKQSFQDGLKLIRDNMDSIQKNLFISYLVWGDEILLYNENVARSSSLAGWCISTSRISSGNINSDFSFVS